jgi:hypothetical protein
MTMTVDQLIAALAAVRDRVGPDGLVFVQTVRGGMAGSPKEQRIDDVINRGEHALVLLLDED